ncbi:alpha/beta hydrolase [Novosphingobium bradum]|uniref:Alpha/beta hydrolase n=1 Tax=Novosphingobium bradum TaxID=1737444 RepID=A0ABV7IKV1_9SPHN
MTDLAEPGGNAGAAGDPLAEVHPDLREAAAAAPQFVMSDETLALMRAGLAERSADRLPDADPDLVCQPAVVPGRDGEPDVGVLIYRRANHPANAPAIITLHGGGYLIGNAATSDRTSREWARAGLTVIAVDYRLAPEHPYPAALNDAWSVLAWAAGEAGGGGANGAARNRDRDWDRSRILVTGDSAGGGLAAALALLARDRGGPALAGQVLIYPMLDDRTRAEPHRAGPDGTLVWPCPSNQYAWRCYLGEAAGGEVPPYAAPARAEDLRGLPPTFMGTGSLDLFYRENLDYARRLAQAGVPVATFVVEGGFHGFDSLAPDAAVTRHFGRAARSTVPFLLECARKDEA